jgi:glutamate--cysteine ligase
MNEYRDLELSTQIVIEEAKKRGVSIEILDRSANFIRLSKDGHSEIVKQATMTGHDDLISYMIMENKVVTKKILSEAGFSVAEGADFCSRDNAINAYSRFKNIKTIIKPKQTNYGIGLSFLEAGFSKEEFEEAIDFAFASDSSILIENFYEGLEYRFLVIDGKTIAVCHRRPANVIGNGKSTVTELVAEKNKDQRRGEGGHTTPLHKLKLEKTELNTLKTQNLSPDSVPDDNQTVWLRKNSNMSTGGDTIDVTDQIHPGYKDIAERSSQFANAKICGVDIIVENLETEPTTNNHIIVELNFNPVLLIHNYPSEGKNRNVGKYVLDLLGF